MSSRPEFEFTAEERHAMLALARSAILGALAGHACNMPARQCACFSLRRGVFVTIYVDGDLRGCIGVIEGRETLGQSIAHCSESAAFRDPRFAALRADEVAGLAIEISILSELFPLDPEKIEIGKHGLFIRTAQRQGLLLPQVAVEHRLSRTQFLEETCHKAGLPRDAWRGAETQLFGFTCEIFQENGSASAAVE
ncbi:MAG TPA: AmmeMemoRadiSam system protein A [Candidatus Eisenbacteria bacterium]|jgi:AmmeMemoRadiSam system protein A|nr:AmmeMemoRadiSam system protein A [Candidatus Eisenbacteria bacterium]